MTTDRVAIVTGGERGIGLAIATRLYREGWHVIAAGLSVGETAGTGVEFRALDVRDRDEVHATISDVVATHGQLDLLVNNAGIQRHATIETMTWDDWSAVVDVNLHGVFNCVQAAGRVMLAAGSGSIVNISSIAAARGAPGRAPYCATKAAVVALTQTAAVEWAHRGVRVNAVGPGYVNTGVLRHGVEAGTLDKDEILARIPAARLAEPDDIAAVVSFLASPAASYINGQVIYVDGGFLANYGVNLNAGPAGPSA